MNKEVQRPCHLCNNMHSAHYQLQKNSALHLLMYCTFFKRMLYIPFEPDLPIVVKETKNKKKLTTAPKADVIQENQLTIGL